MPASRAAPNGDEATALLRATRDGLRQPVPSASAVLALVCPPLDLLALLPVALATNDAWRWPAGASRGSEARGALLGRMLGSLQTAVLELAGAWAAAGPAEGDDEGDDDELALVRQALDSWFCPNPSAGGRTASQAAATLAISGLQVLLHSPAAAAAPLGSGPAKAELSSSPAPLNFTIPLIARIVELYPLSRAYCALASISGSGTGVPWSAKETVAWEAYARALVSVPAKVANATRGGEAYAMPTGLEQARVFGAIVEGIDELLWESKGGAEQRASV
jgi:hypothetical protein